MSKQMNGRRPVASSPGIIILPDSRTAGDWIDVIALLEIVTEIDPIRCTNSNDQTRN